MTSDPTYVAAFAGRKACMADGGVHTTSPDDFFGQVDDLKRSDLGDAAKAARTEALAKLYGRCVEPLSHVMDAHRLAAATGWSPSTGHNSRTSSPRSTGRSRCSRPSTASHTPERTFRVPGLSARSPVLGVAPFRDLRTVRDSGSRRHFSRSAPSGLPTRHQ